MAKAVWNGQTLAESEKTEMVEGNIYFPEETVKREFLKTSSTTSSCPWKGRPGTSRSSSMGRKTLMQHGITRTPSQRPGT
jgi:uncharacterized protein (DUF427 family)